MAMAIPLIAMGIAAVGGAIAGAAGLGANQRDAKNYKVDDNALRPVGGNLGGLSSDYAKDMYNTNVAPLDEAIQRYQMQEAALQQKVNQYDEMNTAHGFLPGEAYKRAAEDPTMQSLRAQLATAQATTQQARKQREAMVLENDNRTYIGSLEQSGLGASQQANDQGNQLMGAGMGNYGQASNLTLAAAQGAAPSVAELQAKQQMGQANQQALGVAASARGGAASALASRAAIQQMGQNDQNIIQQNGILRANEMATARGQLGTLAGQGLGAANQQYSLGEQARENAVGSGLAARGLFSDAAQNREALKAQVQQHFDERNLAVGQQKADAGARIFQGAIGGITAAAGMGAKGAGQ